MTGKYIGRNALKTGESTLKKMKYILTKLIPFVLCYDFKVYFDHRNI